MKHDLGFHPQVENDLLKIRKWYDARVPGLGSDFLSMFDAALDQITASPERHRKVYGEYRRILLRRFPYAIFYQVIAIRIVVFLVQHGARSPTRTERVLKYRRKSQ